MTVTGSRAIAMSSRAPWAPALRASVGLAAVTLLVFGLAYSLLAVGLGGMLFPQAASGSLIERDGAIVGSALVAQPFAADIYFQPRPSASGYDPMALAGSNQARTHPGMRARVEAARAAVASREGLPLAQVPGDLVTQSGGAIDPHVSPLAAQIQVARVARARGLDPQAVDTLVREHTEGRQWGLFGQPRVNVLALNLALDEAGAARRTTLRR